MDTAVDDLSRRQQADRFRATGCPPETLKRIQAGLTNGAQSVDRAELKAVVVALRIAFHVHFISDSAYVLHLLEMILHRQWDLRQFCKYTNFDLIIELFAAIGTRTASAISWEKIQSHQSLSGIHDDIDLYKALGNDAVDRFAKEQWLKFPNHDRQLVNTIASHFEEWSSMFEQFCSFACEVTYRISKSSKGEDNVGLVVDSHGNIEDELSRWEIRNGSHTVAIPDIPDFPSKFVYGERYMLGLRQWLASLTWPDDQDMVSPGITWLELYVDFVCSTGIRMPTCIGQWEGCQIFEATKGAILLRENPLIDRIAYFRQSIRAVAYLSNQSIFPFDKITNKCRSLMRYESGRPQSGLLVRPVLVNQALTMMTIRQFHSQGRNAKNTGGKLASHISIPLDRTVLVVAQIDDSCFRQRIRSWLSARYRNCAHRARIRKQDAVSS
eukprot:Skav219152  [mRNA]  locus=scaffold1574:837152:838471:+ [translate_table: standard]